MHLVCITCPSSSSYNDGSQEMLTMVPIMSLLYARSCAMLMTELFPDNGSLVIWWYTGGVVCRARRAWEQCEESSISLNHHKLADGQRLWTRFSVLVMPSISWLRGDKTICLQLSAKYRLQRLSPSPTLGLLNAEVACWPERTLRRTA